VLCQHNVFVVGCRTIYRHA